MIRYKLTDETKIVRGVTVHRILWLSDNRLGGWIANPECLPQDGTAVLYDDATILNGNFRDGTFLGGEFWGGEFWGGEFRGGEFFGGNFRDGEFWGGEFRGGEFFGGNFRDGEFWGGEFWGGEFWGGTFLGGEFWGGTFLGGTFLGGEFWSSPSCAQRSDGYMFVAKMVDGELRIWAGCRNFSWDEAVAHWGCQNHHHHAESMRIIEFLRAQEEAACK